MAFANHIGEDIFYRDFNRIEFGEVVRESKNPFASPFDEEAIVFCRFASRVASCNSSDIELVNKWSASVSLKSPMINQRVVFSHKDRSVEAWVVDRLDEHLWRIKAFGFSPMIYNSKKQKLELDGRNLSVSKPHLDHRLWKAVESMQSDRCCNIHMARLYESESRASNGSKLLLCPDKSCSVGVWSSARGSTPADGNLRSKRASCFQIAKDAGMLGHSQLANGVSIIQQFGKMNHQECEAFLAPAPAPAPATARPLLRLPSDPLSRMAHIANAWGTSWEAGRTIALRPVRGVVEEKKVEQPESNIQVQKIPEKIREIEID